jgi:hypothetical protein
MGRDRRRDGCTFEDGEVVRDVDGGDGESAESPVRNRGSTSALPWGRSAVCAPALPPLIASLTGGGRPPANRPRSRLVAVAGAATVLVACGGGAATAEAGLVCRLRGRGSGGGGGARRRGVERGAERGSAGGGV